MPAHESEAADVERRANRLYWESDESVNDIADALDLSKGALYGMIQPLPTGLSCPECGSAMEYPNRTARDKGFVVCDQCGLEEDEELVRGAHALEHAPPPPDGVPSATRTFWATALLGAAAGLLVVRWMRKR